VPEEGFDVFESHGPKIKKKKKKKTTYETEQRKRKELNSKGRVEVE
jgi:hypothetical protein